MHRTRSGFNRSERRDCIFTAVQERQNTPVWSREDAKTLLDSIFKDSVSGLLDLALIAAMFYSFARVSAVLKLKFDDYYHNGARRRLRLHDRGVEGFRQRSGP
jgi:hypothetical protein